MKILKPLVSSISLKSFNRWALIYPLSGLVLVLFFLQVITNQTKEVDSIYQTTYSEIEKQYRKRFNLMIEKPAENGKECTLDYINAQKLEQDHPCVLKLIRHRFLDPPFSREVPYNLSALMFPDTSYDNAVDPLRVLKKKKGGFFIECGGNDGLLDSNTLELEKNHNWTGLLIEASPLNYRHLRFRKRKSWSSNVCLSLYPYPTKMTFPNPPNETGVGAAPALFRIIETDKNGDKIFDRDIDLQIKKMEMKDVQCFPFYSMLLAFNQTSVDYFALDVEGHERRILETIPWAKVDIKAIRSEVKNIPLDHEKKNGSVQLRELLEGEPGYLNFKALPRDEFFIKNYL